MTAKTGPCRMKPNRCPKSRSCPDSSSVTRNIKCASSSNFFNFSIKYARIKPRAKHFPLSKSRLRGGVSRQRPGEPPETSHSQDIWCKTTEPESSFFGPLLRRGNGLPLHVDGPPSTFLSTYSVWSLIGEECQGSPGFTRASGARPLSPAAICVESQR